VFRFKIEIDTTITTSVGLNAGSIMFNDGGPGVIGGLEQPFNILSNSLGQTLVENDFVNVSGADNEELFDNYMTSVVDVANANIIELNQYEIILELPTNPAFRVPSVGGSSGTGYIDCFVPMAIFTTEIDGNNLGDVDDFSPVIPG